MTLPAQTAAACANKPTRQTRLAIIARDVAQLSARDTPTPSSSTPPARARRNSPTPSAPRSSPTARWGTRPWSRDRAGARNLTRPQARLATSYRAGDIVVFRKSEKGQPRAGIGHRVEAVDTATGTVRLLPDKRPRQRTEPKPVDWQPARWGADVAEAFVEVAHEFRAGDQVQFTRNNYRAERHNGNIAEVVAIDPTGPSMVVARKDGRHDMLDLAHLTHRHVQPR